MASCTANTLKVLINYQCIHAPFPFSHFELFLGQKSRFSQHPAKNSAIYNSDKPYTTTTFNTTLMTGYPGGGAAQRKSGVASLRTFRCGMGGLKLEHCVDVYAHKMGVKMNE